MTGVVLIGWLCAQSWTWPVGVGVDAYRVYTTADPEHWCEEWDAEIPASSCTGGVCEWDPKMPHADLYFTYVPVRGGVEDPWLHPPRVRCQDVEE